MTFDQQQRLQRLADAQRVQNVTGLVEEDWDVLYQEAQALISVIGQEPDTESRDDLEEFWGQALANFGADWEDLLDLVHEEADAAEEQGLPYHPHGQMYWLVLDRCYELLEEEDSALYREMFRHCLSCLRATRTLQESLAREALEKRSFGPQGR